MTPRSSLVVAVLTTVLAGRAAAQSPAPAARPGAAVSGVVRDSLAHAPLVGATVQLVAVDDPASSARSATSDSLGRYTLDDVPAGRYTIGFFHPMLDSLGVEAPMRAVAVDGGRPLRADLATPAPAQLRAAICGTPAADSGAVVVGVVRDARDGAPVAGATVSGQWLEYTFAKAGIQRRMPRLAATTGENGWFALCNVPRDGTMALLAARGADSTALLDVQVPAEGFLRRELYLGAAQTVVEDSTRRRYAGDGRLSGTVLAAASGQPLADAQVGVADGPQTRTNERGEWTLGGAPLGTRMLEVRAVGYYPERRPVNVVAGTPPVRVALNTLKAVLDTVRVSAARRADRLRSGFDDRRRRGGGRFLTPEDIARRNAIVVSDLFRMMPGVRVEGMRFGADTIRLRGTFADLSGRTDGRCDANVYIDGMYIPGATTGDIDTHVKPEDILGIEVYAGPVVPPQFQPGLSGCGSIVIWTK